MTEGIVLVTIEAPDRRTELTGYRFFWAKAVRGFERSEHCAKCLRGTFLKTDGRWEPPVGVPRAFVLGPKYRALYICGVSRKGYEFNLHAPCEPAPGDGFALAMVDDQMLIVQGARLLPIPPLPDGWQQLPRSFTSCRNFQFAVSMFGYRRPGERVSGVSSPPRLRKKNGRHDG